MPNRDRINFATDTVEAQINQNVEEIIGNHAAHLTKHFRRRIRDFRFDQARLETAVAKARDKMLSAYYEDNSVAKELRTSNVQLRMSD